MEPVKVRIGRLVFDHADYDAESDLLYLHIGSPQPAEGEETPEGHVVRYAPGSQRFVGLTVLNARWLLDRDGHLSVTIPETVQAPADELAAALGTACEGGPANAQLVGEGEPVCARERARRSSDDATKAACPCRRRAARPDGSVELLLPSEAVAQTR